MTKSKRAQGENLALSYFFALGLGLLIIAPNIPYTIPLIVNTFFWCYLTVACGFLGMCVLRTSLPVSFKILSAYLFASCFISQVPYASFNAYLLVSVTFWLFIFLQKADFEIIVNVLEGAFWLEFILGCFQLAHHDRLLSFGAATILDAKGQLIQMKLVDLHQPVVMGTVMQYMRFGSLLTIMAPFLIRRNRLYVIPITLACLVTQSSSFAMSLIAGGIVYLLLSLKTWKNRMRVIVYGFLVVLAYAIYDYGSFDGAIDPSHGGRLSSWAAIWITWFRDTTHAHPPPFTGPVNWQWFFFGHGMDTFLSLFPVYKHDINPFPQAHNDWLQFLWEIGLVGFSLITIYSVNLVRRLYKICRYDLIAGCTCIAVNMFFTFPTRMTQTMFLIAAWLAYCESELTRCGDYQS